MSININDKNNNNNINNITNVKIEPYEPSKLVGSIVSVPTKRFPIQIQEYITEYGNLETRLGTNLGTNK